MSARALPLLLALSTGCVLDRVPYDHRSCDLARGLGCLDARTCVDGQCIDAPADAGGADAGFDAGTLGLGLVAHWKFDEGDGGTASDATGHGFDGTFIDFPEWVPGKVGTYALRFDGTNDSVTVATGFQEVTTSLTFTAWLNLHAQPVNVPRVIVNKEKMNTSNTLLFGIDTGRRLYLVLNHGGTEDFQASVGMVPLNTWKHVAATWAADAGLVFCIDGACESAIAVPPGALVYDSDPLALGAASDTAAYHLNGDLDDVRIYNRALSTAEVQELYGLR